MGTGWARWLLVCLSPDRLATFLTAAATWWVDRRRCMPGRLWLDRWPVVACCCATLFFFDSLPRYVFQSNVGVGQELAAVQTLLDLTISAVTTFNPGTTTFRASTRRDPRNHSSHRAPGWFLPFRDNSQTSGAVSDCMEWVHVVAGRDGDN